MRKKSIITVSSVALAALLIFAFQNCGFSGFDSAGSSSTSSDPGEPGSESFPTPPPGTPSDDNASFNIGDLDHDGPTTFEQLSLLLPVTGELTYEATASVVFRKTSESNWYQAHPLHRIRPEFSASSSQLVEGFAGVITGLEPGVEYEVQVAVQVGSDVDTRTLVISTRSLPVAGKVTHFVAAGSSAEKISDAISALEPGDVLELESGTYEVDRLGVRLHGTAEKPIVIRGASRSETVLHDPTGRVLYLVESSHLVIENLTLRGSGVDSGTSASSEGVSFWSNYQHKNITLRNLTIEGVDKGIVGHDSLEQVSVYDCTLIGNNQWDQDYYSNGGSGAPGAGDGKRDGEQNIFWNDDGIRIPGRGNVAFNNTLHGFGDALAVKAYVFNGGVHFYRNDITMTGDDAFEGDYAHRNVTFYDNRVHNAMTFVSFDPVYGGPAFVFRNIAINIRRGPFKLNNTNTGLIINNNTIVTTDGLDFSWAWVQFNNGAIRAWSYRNNILIRKNVPKLLAMEASGQDPIDLSHNAWYPDGSIWWTNSGGSFGSLSEAFSGLSATTPLFGDSTQRHAHDLISEEQPFQNEIPLGVDYRTFVAASYAPRLRQDSKLRGSGVAIPGITDSFSNEAPDMGAVLTGRPVPVYGDRTE